MIHQIRACSGRILVAALLFAAMLLPATALAQLLPNNTTGEIDSIVALVDEDIILRSELDQAIAGIVQQIRARGEALPPMHLLESQVLERLIITELQVQRALQTGIRISDADIDQYLVNIAQNNNITVQQMRQSIEADGMEFAEFRRNVGEQLMTERLQQRIVNGMDPITDTEVDILLASEDEGGGEYNVSHIMILLGDGSTPQQVAQAQAKADDIHQRLVDGLEFSSAAISYSEGQEALQGGLIGWRDLNSVPAFFADAVRGMQAGEFTAPVRSPMGFHIIKVNDFREQRQVVVKEYNARHIMVEVNELVTPRLAMEQIVEIQEKLEAGEDFGELAKEYSDDTSSANIGGDMGWFPPEAYGDRVYQTLSGLETGEVSQPFQTAGGWHIIELLGIRETDRTEEAIRAEARDKILRQKANQEIEKVLRQFRDEAFVEIRLAGNESGSS
ncbi:MAG: peptidylprolyl isomerase [Xanthomonadales bacterium]|jgi:peptidyl-prolyl cis-trans isomerase SurA|nr:peptidylprolyl isomerase [Xanthomonadales bacterium]